MLSTLHDVHELLSDPAWTGALELLLIVIVGFEIKAARADRKHIAIAKQTYELYKTYFEVTEKRKAEAREKAAATRAAKKNPQPAPVPEPEPQPPTLPGEVPPLIAMPEEEAENK